MTSGCSQDNKTPLQNAQKIQSIRQPLKKKQTSKILTTESNRQKRMLLVHWKHRKQLEPLERKPATSLQSWPDHSQKSKGNWAWSEVERLRGCCSQPINPTQLQQAQPPQHTHHLVYERTWRLHLPSSEDVGLLKALVNDLTRQATLSKCPALFLDMA